jgi:hypothetical protein
MGLRHCKSLSSCKVSSLISDDFVFVASGREGVANAFGSINCRAAPRFASQEDNLRAVRKVIDQVPGQLGPSSHVIDAKLRYGFVSTANVAVHGYDRHNGCNHLIHRRHQGVHIKWCEEDAVYAFVDGSSQVARLLG